jgi:GMP synthase (glutamine-hydrolysing)
MGFVANADTRDDRPLLVIQHVPWEGPHVILDSFPDVTVQVHHPLDEPERTPLPDPSTIRGAVVMGGPMSVNDTDTLPALADEVAWLQHAVGAQLPILGICLGAQLLAKAAGATIAAGEPEIGVAPVTITEPHDPLASLLFPHTHAMHWHGEQFTLPAGAVLLAKSAHTPAQAFRLGTRAWGMLFHLEVDDTLLASWLAEPTMAAEAEAVLGGNFRQRLRGGLPLLKPTRARAVFDEFAKICRQPRNAMADLDSGYAYAPASP